MKEVAIYSCFYHATPVQSGIQPPNRYHNSFPWYGRDSDNHLETGGRSVPSVMNKQEIDLYLAMPDALYLNDARSNGLRQLSANDECPPLGKQPVEAGASLNIVYVADQSKTATGKRQDLCGF